MITHFDGDIIGDIYDLIFRNYHHIGTDFVEDFKDSYIDSDNARIYLKNDHEEYVINITKTFVSKEAKDNALLGSV
jgi:hypothetical protein